mmetsp:Transcript_52260/g.71323  ORF Transcript_52260/g.71323 Transcript_52260/m.71323 type:complete len:295 (-) Transcript_52260:449-1333(-)
MFALIYLRNVSSYGPALTDHRPPQGVRLFACLHRPETLVQVLRHGTRFIAEEIFLLSVLDASYGSDDDCRTACCHLLKRVEFCHWDWTPLHLSALILRQIHEAFIRDARQHGRRFGRDVGAVLGDAKEVGGGELFDESVRPCVEVKTDRESVLLHLLVRLQVRRVVTRHLDVTDSVWGCAVVTFNYSTFYRSQLPSGVVISDGHGKKNKGILVRWGEPNPWTGSEQKWANIECPLAARGWNVIEIITDQPLGRRHEVIHGKAGHHGPVGGPGHALRILVWSEHAHGAVLPCESL